MRESSNEEVVGNSPRMQRTPLDRVRLVLTLHLITGAHGEVTRKSNGTVGELNALVELLLVDLTAGALFGGGAVAAKATVVH